jgi:DNA-binding CsgD family transcriptional regulator
VHLRNIFGKLGAGSRSEAVARAIQAGWITLEVNDE